MAVQKQDDQHEHTFSSYVRIRDVVLKTYLGRWMIGRSGERGSGISVLPARWWWWWWWWRIDTTQQNSKCRLCGDRDEMIIHIISECKKIAQKQFKTSHDWLERWLSGNCARNWNLTIWTSDICTTQNPSWKTRRTNFFEIYGYKRITLISAWRPGPTDPIYQPLRSGKIWHMVNF